MKEPTVNPRNEPPGLNLESLIMSKKNKVVLFASLAILIVVVGGIALHKLGPYHFRTVTPGVLYRSGSLRDYNLALIADRYQIKSIVSLRLKNEKGWQAHWYEMEESFCKANGMNFFHIPLRGNQPPSDEQLEEWLDILSDPANYPILVHCAQGVVRTGIMTAIYQIEFLGEDNRKVWEDLPRYGHDFDIPKRKAMKNYILNYQPRRRARVE